MFILKLLYFCSWNFDSSFSVHISFENLFLLQFLKLICDASYLTLESLCFHSHLFSFSHFLLEQLLILFHSLVLPIASPELVESLSLVFEFFWRKLYIFDQVLLSVQQFFRSINLSSSWSIWIMLTAFRRILTSNLLSSREYCSIPLQLSGLTFLLHGH